MTTTGERISELRRKRSMTQPQLAEKLNVSQSTITSWENDRRSLTQEGVINLSNLFGVTTDYILGQEPLLSSAPDWATPQDKLDLLKALDDDNGFSFGGAPLSDEENDKLKIALTQIFWNKLRDRKAAGSDMRES